MKVVILCGGKGTRLREETEYRPKPMVLIGGRPILWHIMKTYAHYGYDDFVICLGYKGSAIKEYFLNYQEMNNDFTIELGTQKKIKLHTSNNGDRERNWKITLVDTGEEAQTGARVKRVERYLDGETFMLTYGDGVANINVQNLLKYHRKHGLIGTMTGVRPSSRFGEIVLDHNRVKVFNEKPQVTEGLINGGYFVFNAGFFDYLKDDDACILEKEPLSSLVADSQLMVYPHSGFWQCMDTYRESELLNGLWKGGNAPWKIW